MTVNHRLYATFKEVCFAYGLLNDDREWTKALSEASLWALGPQLRDIFITMLLFCNGAKPLKLWETNWQALSEDILHKKQKLYKYPELQLADEQILQLLSERRIVLAVASSGIASLLLPAGRTAHSRFSHNHAACWEMRFVKWEIDTSKQEFNRWVLPVEGWHFTSKDERRGR
ncbi:ATP-dependent DNA helicase PIF1-like protein [Tanacetum coccineum]